MPLATSIATRTDRESALRERLDEAAVNGLAVRADDGLGVAKSGTGVGRQVAELQRRRGVDRCRLAGFLLLTRFDGEEPRLGGAQISVPVADGIAAVQDGGDLVVLARLAAFLVAVLVRGPGQHGGVDEEGAGILGGQERADSAGPGEHHAGLAAVRGQHPQRVDGVRLGRFRVGAGGSEVEVAVGGKHGPGLALGAARDPAGLLLPRRVQLPQGGAVFGALGVERGHGGDQPPAVGAQRQAAHPRDGEVVVQVVEGGLGFFAQGR